MNKPQIILTGILIGMAIYAPVGVYLFDNSLSMIFDRAYFMIGGAVIALYGSGRPVTNGA